MLKTILPAGLWWGSVGGLLTVIWMLAEYVLGLHAGGAGRYSGYLSALITLGAVYLACRRVRAASPEGRLPMAQGVMTGAIASAVAGLIVAAWLYYYLTSVNPGFITRQLAEQERALAARGLSAEETLRRMLAARDMATPARQAMSLALTSPIGGAIFGVVAWYLLRRPRPAP